MKILIVAGITALALPLMALGQTTEPQQSAAQGQTNEPQTSPAKGKKLRPDQEQNKAEGRSATDKNLSGQTNAQSRGQDTNRSETGARSSTSQKTTVNKQEFKSRHSEVFNLGRHPKEFFVQRFGANHFRLIGNTYFVFVDSCWVAVDVDGFTYTERVICPGDPDFIEVD
jgi:hypothetical protein